MEIKQGQVAVITGAGSGIGRQLATLLAGRGCALALADINETGLAETVKGLPKSAGKVSKHILDVSDRAAYERFVKSVVRAHKTVDLVINNAGVAHAAKLEEVSLEDFEWLMGVNFWGVVYGSKMFLPYLRKQEQGYIVNVSSIFGLISVPYNGIYNASKFAVRGFTEALRQELAIDSNIKVSCVHPGGIRTNIAKNARFVSAPAGASHDEIAKQFDQMAFTTAARAAKVIIEGIEQDKRRILIGPDARIVDWTQRLLPSWYDRIMIALHNRTASKLGDK